MWENLREPRPRPQPAGLGLSLKTWRESARRGKSIRSAYFRDPESNLIEVSTYDEA